MSERDKMMKKLMALSFMMYDAHLFLNSHPKDKQALEFYNKYKTLYEEAVKDYEKKFGPITAAGVGDSNTWTWATTPWPWERSE